MRDVWGRAKDHAAEGGCNRKHGLVPWREKMVRDRHLLLDLFDNLCFLSSLLRTLPPEQQIPITVVEMDDCHLVQNT